MTRAMKRFIGWLIAIVILFILFVLTGPFYIVNEGKQVVITRFSKIVDSHEEAGLYIKVPFLDQVTEYPKLILSLDGDPQSITTKENQYIIVDTTSRWRITDPEAFYKNFQTLANSYNKLSDIIDSSCRTVITQNRMSEIVRSSNIINETKAEEQTDEETIEINNLVNADTTNEVDGVSVQFLLMICLVFFAFTTILGWDYYSEKCLEYLTGGNMSVVKVYRWLYIIAVAIGPYMTISAVWTIADITNGLMAIPNCISLIVLSGLVAKETKAYFDKYPKL